MSRALGQRIVIENIPGAGGTTDATRGMRASPDGYTIQLGHMGTHAIAPAFYRNLAYKPDVDFAPIGLAAGTPIVILGKKDFPPKDLKEFIPYVKANAGKLNVAACRGRLCHSHDRLVAQHAPWRKACHGAHAAGASHRQGVSAARRSKQSRNGPSGASTGCSRFSTV
jgi:hypothetical protein